jgi:hypothetical protein
MNERERRAPSPPIHCPACRHFCVTWDERFPHGCRAFDIKSGRTPSRIVHESSGLPCQAYHPRPHCPGQI